MEGYDLTTVLLFCIIFLVSLLWFYRPKGLEHIPGPKAWPIIGNILQINQISGGASRDNLTDELNKKYGNICRLYIGTYPLVIVQGHKYVSEILSRRGKDFIDRPTWLPGIQKTRQVTGGVGVAMESGEAWKDRRKFAMRTMRDFGVGKASVEERILEEAENIAEDLEKMKGKEVTDIKQMMTSASCNVIHGIIFGFRYKHGEKALNDLIDYMNTIFSVPGFLSAVTVYPVLNLLFGKSLVNTTKGFKAIKKYIDQQVLEHRKSFDKDNIRDFVDYFLEAELDQSESKSNLNSNALFNIIVDLFAAGTDTTSTTLNWSILYMMENQDVQKKCQDEISKVIGQGRNVRLSDRRNLPYVEATLMEIQRLANTAPMSLPHVAIADTTIGRFHVPNNCIVMASLRSAHMDKTIWENPEEFNPMRFLNEKMEIINKEYLIPFSMGPRVCLGESLARSELFLIFSNLIQKFTFTKVDKNDVLSFEAGGGAIRSALPYRVLASPR